MIHLEELDSNIKNSMLSVIYIRLLGEGTNVFRPVPAAKINNNIYMVDGYEIYDPEDEVWEFTPGTTVIVQEQTLDKEIVFVAKQKINDLS